MIVTPWEWSRVQVPLLQGDAQRLLDAWTHVRYSATYPSVQAQATVEGRPQVFLVTMRISAACARRIRRGEDPLEVLLPSLCVRMLTEEELAMREEEPWVTSSAGWQ